MACVIKDIIMKLFKKRKIKISNIMPSIVMVSNVHKYANLEVMQVHILSFILYSHCVILIKINVGDYHVTRHIVTRS